MGKPWDYVDLDGWPVGDKCMEPAPGEPGVFCRRPEGHYVEGVEAARHAPAMSDLMRRRGKSFPEHPGPPPGVEPGPLHPVFEQMRLGGGD